MVSDKDDLLFLIPDYHKGKLSPSAAHRVARKLEEDDNFRDEAQRELMLYKTFNSFDLMNPSNDLVASSVFKAVGDISTKKWISLDSIILAVGVGILCGAIAQFLTAYFSSYEIVGNGLLDLAALIAENSVLTLFSGFILAGISIIIAGVWISYRMIRS